MSTVHSEKDSMGAIDAPADKLWGVQTQRSLEYFHISTEKMPILLIHTLVLTKRAAAEVNEDLGLLSEEKTSTIRQAADEVLVGQHNDEFPLVVWQTGSSMQSNMNINEVLANRASKLLGGVRGMEREVRPNDGVNKSQSFSDVFPTVIYVAVLLALRRRLILQLKALIQTLNEKFRASTDIVKIGRIYLQDIVPLTLGQEISGWVAVLEHNLKHIEYSLLHAAELALGGTAVGTGLNTHPEYAYYVVDELAVITYAPFATMPDKFEALATCDALVQTHGALRGLAASLMEIANDIRQPASGPCCGIGEISIPEGESGSSIIPGKANPTQYEVLTTLYCQVMGDDVAINTGGASGNFELNIFHPVVIHSFLQPVRLLASGMESFNKHCVMDIEPNRKRINQLSNGPLMLVTALNTYIGYDKATEIAKRAHKKGLTLKAMALVLGYPSEAELDGWVRPKQMVGSMKAGR